MLVSLKFRKVTWSALYGLVLCQLLARLHNELVDVLFQVVNDLNQTEISRRMSKLERRRDVLVSVEIGCCQSCAVRIRGHAFVINVEELLNGVAVLLLGHQVLVLGCLRRKAEVHLKIVNCRIMLNSSKIACLFRFATNLVYQGLAALHDQAHDKLPDELLVYLVLAERGILKREIVQIVVLQHNQKQR